MSSVSSDLFNNRYDKMVDSFKQSKKDSGKINLPVTSIIGITYYTGANFKKGRTMTNITAILEKMVGNNKTERLVKKGHDRAKKFMVSTVKDSRYIDISSPYAEKAIDDATLIVAELASKVTSLVRVLNEIDYVVDKLRESISPEILWCLEWVITSSISFEMHGGSCSTDDYQERYYSIDRSLDWIREDTTKRFGENKPFERFIVSARSNGISVIDENVLRDKKELEVGLIKEGFKDILVYLSYDYALFSLRKEFGDMLPDSVKMVINKRKEGISVSNEKILNEFDTMIERVEDKVTKGVSKC